MKFTIERNHLLTALQLIIGAVEKRHTMAILGNVLIETNKKRLLLTTTDSEITTSVHLDININSEPTKTTLPARKLLDICRGLPDGSSIIMESTGHRALIKTQQSRFTLATLPADNFPVLEKISGNCSFSLPAKQFKNLLIKTAFAMANQDVRYYLNGLMLEVNNQVLRAVATDGHRLAMSEIMLDTQTSDAQQIIVPRKAIQELHKILGEIDTELDITISDNFIRFQTEGITFTSKLIDGRFPDYRAVMPEQGDNVLTLECPPFKEALQRAAILSNEKYRGVRLHIASEQVTINANNTEQEEAEERLFVDYNGNPMEVGFNVQYLLDVINAIESENIEFYFTNPNNSALIRDPLCEGSSYVIMPMRL